VLFHSQRPLVSQDVCLHVSHADLVKGLEDTQLNLSFVKLALAHFVLAVFESFQISFDCLLEFVVRNLRVSVFKLRCQQNYRVFFVRIGFLRLSSLRFVEMPLVNYLPCLRLGLFQQIVVVHELQVLQVEGVRELNAVSAVVHHAVQHFSLVEGDHQQFHVLSRDFRKGLVARKSTLTLHFVHKLFKALQRAQIAFVGAVNEIVVSHTLLFKSQKNLL